MFVWLDVAPVITFNCICGPEWSFNPTLSGKPDKWRRLSGQGVGVRMVTVAVSSPGTLGRALREIFIIKSESHFSRLLIFLGIRARRPAEEPV